MTAGTIADWVGGIGGGLVVLLGVVVGLRKLFGARSAPLCPVNAGEALTHLADAIDGFAETAREQTRTLGEIRDGIVALRSDVRMTALEQGHLQKSVDALHGRFDNVLKTAAMRGGNGAG